MVTQTNDTLAQFIEEASWTERAKTVVRLGTRYADGALAEAERQAAIEVFRIAIYDSEPLVRRVLAESLKRAQSLPRDIVLALAHDKPEVATPFLVASPLLTEEDLREITKSGSPEHRAALRARLPRLLPRRPEPKPTPRPLVVAG